MIPLAALALLVGAVHASAFDLHPSEDGSGRIAFGLPAHVELTPSDDGWIVSCPGQSGALPAGSPDLPVFARLVPLVPGSSYSAQVVAVEYAVVTQNVSVAAVAVRETEAVGLSDTISRLVRRKDPAIYDSDGFWPSGHVSIRELWQGRRKLARVELRPVQYDPATGTVRVCRSLEIQLDVVPSRIPEGPRGPLRRSTAAKGEGR